MAGSGQLLDGAGALEAGAFDGVPSTDGSFFLGFFSPNQPANNMPMVQTHGIMQQAKRSKITMIIIIIRIH